MTQLEALDRLAIGIIERAAPDDPAMERLHDNIERTPLVRVPLYRDAADAEQARRDAFEMTVGDQFE